MATITETELRKAAEDMGLFYPQYFGHFDGWAVATMPRNLHFKEYQYGTSSAIMAAEGDAVLVKASAGRQVIAILPRWKDGDEARTLWQMEYSGRLTRATEEV